MVSDITYKDKKKSGVYSISSLTDGRVYVGSAIDLYTRYMNHKKDLSKNSHCNKKLQNFYNKYEDYYKAAQNRIREYRSQLKLSL
jgi:predicted GIY-YIG superfamily endonuclease